jgi:hypothetical protein
MGMTIAACHVSSEGVVRGAGRTTTNEVPHPSKATGHTHHFHYGQKILEVGNGSSVGIATWEVGAFFSISYRNRDEVAAPSRRGLLCKTEVAHEDNKVA